MRTDQERHAYAKGYNAGRSGWWPAHKPPLPPDVVIAGFLKASRELRDAADTICAGLMPDDEFVRELGPKVDAMDEAMRKLTESLCHA